jgi:hypothetical protein
MQIFRRFERYPNWCSDKESRAASSCFSRPQIPGFFDLKIQSETAQDVYQRTNSANRIDKIPESFESLESSHC